MKSWDSFNKFDKITEPYFIARGQGDTKASQIVTALNKLVYKWYNDGDVYDNQYALNGWANDLSSYANWLYYNTTHKTREILSRIRNIDTESEYEDLLYDLCEELFTTKYLKSMDKEKAEDNVYECEGPFKFIEYVECDRCGSRLNPEEDEIIDGMCRWCYQEWESEQEEEEEEED